MNIQSEIDYFSDLGLIDKARLLSRLMFELAEIVKLGDEASDVSRLRFANEINQRLSRLIYQLLSEDSARPQDDVIVRMLLGGRADKSTERIMHDAYRQVLSGFETHDATVLLNKS